MTAPNQQLVEAVAHCPFCGAAPFENRRYNPPLFEHPRNFCIMGGIATTREVWSRRAATQATDGECQKLRSALEIAVATLGRVNVRCFDKPESPLKPLGDIGREALSAIAAMLGDEAYDAISVKEQSA